MHEVRSAVRRADIFFLRLAGALAAAVLLTLLPGAQAASARCRGAHALPSDGRPAASASSVVCEINRARRAHGLRSIMGQRRLRKAAARYARDMVDRRF